MKKVLVIVFVIGCCLLFATRGHPATLLSNAELTVSEFTTYFSSFPTGPVLYIPFSINGETPQTGQIVSAVSQSLTPGLYAYLYAINMDTTTPNDLGAYAMQWGFGAPQSYNFGIGTYDSWTGSYTDGWTGYSVGNFAPTSASYVPTNGSLTWTFENELEEGQWSTWMIVISNEPPGLAPASVIDGTDNTVSGDVYAPVPEPATMLLLGSGLLGLAGLWRKFKK